MNHTLLTLLAATALTASAQYTNPVLSGMHPDPSVTVTPDGDFWLVNSSFCFYPGVPLYHSRDLINWEQRGYVLDTPEQLPLKGANVWGGIYAPTIRYSDGRFYMITTNVSGGGNFLVHTTDPAAGWSSPVKLSQGGIDPSLYFEDGHCWMVSNPDGQIWLCEIDPITGKTLSESRPIWAGTGGRYPEGPHIYKKDGWYYLMIAEGGTELAHCVTIARSRSISGPYTANPANPILTHCKAEAQENIIQGTGHADMVQAPDGSWWMVFLGFRFQNGSHHLLGRETFLAPVKWDEGEWPIVNGGSQVLTDMVVPTLPLSPIAHTSDCSDFSGERIPDHYMWLRNPEMNNYALADGYLRMRPTPLTLDSTDGSPSVLFRRQTDINFTASTTVSLEDVRIGTEAGLTVWTRDRHHYDIYLSCDSDSLRLGLRYRLSEIDHTAAVIPISGSATVTLTVTGSADKYIFSATLPDGQSRTLGSINNKFLSTETAGGFTGTMLGLYATSPSRDGCAVFSPIIYSNLTPPDSD